MTIVEVEYIVGFEYNLLQTITSLWALFDCLNKTHTNQLQQSNFFYIRILNISMQLFIINVLR